MPKTKTQVLPDINWKKKFKKYYKAPKSVNVTVTLNNGSKALVEGHKVLTFIIRDNLWKQFGTKSILFGIFKNRIYFRPEEDRRAGYSICVKNTTGYIKCTLSGNDVEQYECFIGDYTLRYDKYYELYYIDIEQEGVIQ